MNPNFCGAEALSCQASIHSIPALSAHIGSPLGSMQVHPLVPSLMTFILPSDPIFKIVALSSMFFGAAPLSFCMSCLSLIVACCACVTEICPTTDEMRKQALDCDAWLVSGRYVDGT